MKLYQVILPTMAAFAVTAALPASAQSTTETKVSRDTDVKNGVATDKVKVVNVEKHKTHRAKRVLGVKVGHKTAKTKTVKEMSQSSNGDESTKVKSTHN